MSDPKSFAGRPIDKAGLLGQVLTPNEIARRMAQELLADRGTAPVRLLDPCVGPGTFPNAIHGSRLLTASDEITAVDIDSDMIAAARAALVDSGVKHVAVTADYLETQFDVPFDYAILNPPYVRQEWIDAKLHYQASLRTRYGLKIPGTANLYVYFLTKVVMDLRPGGAFSSIVYDSWLVTGYGRWLMRFLLANCDPLVIEPVVAQPFAGRMIDATIIRCVRKPNSTAAVDALGGTKAVERSKGPLAGARQFVPIGEIFNTKRGLRLKQADFFLAGLEQVNDLGATPFVKKVTKINGYVVQENHPEAALIIRPGDRPSQTMAIEIDRRLATAVSAPEKNASILTWQRERPETWFTHRVPPYAPLLFNYYLRGIPRHIYNPSRAFSDNFYGLTPKNDVSPLAWLAVLNSTAASIEILSNARSQGAGLAKVQLFEYRRAEVFDLRKCSNADRERFHELGMQLVGSSYPAAKIVQAIDKDLYQASGDPTLNPDRLEKVIVEVRSRFNRSRAGRA